MFDDVADNKPNQTDGPAPIAVAIAEHFGIEIDKLSGFVLAAEYQNGDHMSLSSAWSLNVPSWALIGYAVELRKQLERVFDE